MLIILNAFNHGALEWSIRTQLFHQQSRVIKVIFTIAISANLWEFLLAFCHYFSNHTPNVRCFFKPKPSLWDFLQDFLFARWVSLVIVPSLNHLFTLRHLVRLHFWRALHTDCTRPACTGSARPTQRVERRLCFLSDWNVKLQPQHVGPFAYLSVWLAGGWRECF